LRASPTTRQFAADSELGTVLQQIKSLGEMNTSVQVYDIESFRRQQSYLSIFLSEYCFFEGALLSRQLRRLRENLLKYSVLS
jgi:hypothetical protein